jgi:hypothetical protein
MSLGLFRLVGSVGRTQVLSNILAGLTYQLVFVLGGFIVAKSKIHHVSFLFVVISYDFIKILTSTLFCFTYR